MRFQEYSIATRMLGWDERFIYVEHAFETADKINALLIVKTRIVGKCGEQVSPKEMLELAEIDRVDDIHMDEVLEAWNDGTRRHWQQVT